METVKDQLDGYRDAMANYTLTITHDAPSFRCYRLGPPGETGMGVASLIFTSRPLSEQIIVTGDLCPGTHGIISSRGYGIGWFGNPKSPRYLCEKFLRTGYHAEIALEWMQRRLANALSEVGEADGKERERLADQTHAIQEALDDGDDGPARSAEAFGEWYVDTFDDYPEGEGYGYDPRDSALLVAIQERFVALYPGAE